MGGNETCNSDDPALAAPESNDTTFVGKTADSGKSLVAGVGS